MVIWKDRVSYGNSLIDSYLGGTQIRDYEIFTDPDTQNTFSKVKKTIIKAFYKGRHGSSHSFIDWE